MVKKVDEIISFKCQNTSNVSIFHKTPNKKTYDVLRVFIKTLNREGLYTNGINDLESRLFVA